ncbi:MAG: primase-helicase zinc-binding domain-containing protein, partial [Elusimicrobiota bacterium]|nr:primase-helicase zinc-binding domain-containing protein [Elusimicrobiota bacterium]
MIDANELMSQARGKWYSILTSLGVPESYLTGKHGACPLCRSGKDRWRWDNKDGRGT